MRQLHREPWTSLEEERACLCCPNYLGGSYRSYLAVFCSSSSTGKLDRFSYCGVIDTSFV